MDMRETLTYLEKMLTRHLRALENQEKTLNRMRTKTRNQILDAHTARQMAREALKSHLSPQAPI